MNSHMLVRYQPAGDEAEQHHRQHQPQEGQLVRQVEHRRRMRWVGMCRRQVLIGRIALHHRRGRPHYPNRPIKSYPLRGDNLTGHNLAGREVLAGHVDLPVHLGGVGVTAAHIGVFLAGNCGGRSSRPAAAPPARRSRRRRSPAAPPSAGRGGPVLPLRADARQALRRGCPARCRRQTRPAARTAAAGRNRAIPRTAPRFRRENRSSAWSAARASRSAGGAGRAVARFPRGSTRRRIRSQHLVADVLQAACRGTARPSSSPATTSISSSVMCIGIEVHQANPGQPVDRSSRRRSSANRGWPSMSRP